VNKPSEETAYSLSGFRARHHQRFVINLLLDVNGRECYQNEPSPLGKLSNAIAAVSQFVWVQI
jgi:hypothetical protein